MAQIKTSKSSEAYHARYKATGFAANRKKKLTKLLKEQPNNEKIAIALKDIHYRRKTPNTAVWSASTKRAAQVLKDWTGYFDMGIINSNPKVASDALKGLPSNAVYTDPKTVQSTAMFSVKARAKSNGKYLFPEASFRAGT